MTQSDRPYYSADDPLYSSRLTKNYVEYIREFYPELDIEPILKYANINSYEIEDQGHWFSQRQVDRFHEALALKTGDPDLPRKVGRYAITSQASGTLRKYALGFTTPASAYRMLERLSYNLSHAFTLTVHQITSNKVEVTVEPEPGVKERPYQCDNRMGLFEGIAKLFTNKYANIEHPVCLQKGGEVGLYVISWETSSALTWKRIRNYSLVLGVSVSLLLLFVLPITPWAILSLVFALLTLTFSFYSSHLEKKDLIKTIETQGNAAKGHLDEMNIRYNNALLIQEIGQATSTILDISELIKTVVKAIAVSYTHLTLPTN